MPIPNHLVLIPDGNRRWARARNLSPAAGHEAGAQRSEEILNAALDTGIRHITMWGSSLDNVTKRSPAEVASLFLIFQTYFQKLIESKRLTDDRVKVSILGRWREKFPKPLVSLFETLVDRTKDHDGPLLTFLMAYSGTDEMCDAINRVAENGKGKWGKRITAEEIKNALWTRDLPPVDLVIRTGGEAHWSSGFMMWDTADAQLHFTETLWPDFDAAALRAALAAYEQTDRRNGA